MMVCGAPYAAMAGMTVMPLWPANSCRWAFSQVACNQSGAFSVLAVSGLERFHCIMAGIIYPVLFIIMYRKCQH